MSFTKLLSVVLAILIVTNPVTVTNLQAQPVSAQFKVYSLKRVQPSEARRMLTDLLGESARTARIVADDQQGEMLVSGTEEVHQLATQLVEQLNRNEPQPVTAQKEPTVLRSYTCSSDDIQGCAATVKRLLGESGRISVDTTRGRIIVVAPEARQQLVQQIFNPAVTTNASISRPPERPLSRPNSVPAIESSDSTLTIPQATRSTEPSFPHRSGFRTHPDSPEPLFSKEMRLAQTESIRTTPQDVVPAQYQMKNITVEQCQRALTLLLNENLTKISDQRFTYTQQSIGTVLLQFDIQANSCLLDGPETLSQQVETLVRQLDESQGREPGEAFRFVPLQNVNPEVLQQAIRLWRESSTGNATLSKEHSLLSQNRGNIQQTAFYQDAATAGNQSADSSAQGGTQPGEDILKRPSSDVSVEALPDLDLLILRGRDPDIAELTRIIREIERLSDETAPQIEVYHLKHVQGDALQSLITQVLDDLTGPLQGRISITPLVKPNALLFIGWGEAVKAAKKLVEELDQPVHPQTQMQIFNLTNALAAEVQTTIEQFLNGRGGLGPDVNLTVNQRTNSVIVNASPRDMKEVAELVARLDEKTTGPFHQAKSIKLKNSLASDVAATITATIAAARGGGTGGQNRALEMLLVDPNGKRVLRSGLLDEVTLTPDVRTNSIFITGPAESLPLVEQLILSLDESPTNDAQIKIFQIANGDASDLVSVLRTLFPEAGASTVPQLATAEGETSLVPVRFSVDIRTNSIITTGTSGDLKIIEALLLRLDDTESQDRINRVFKLKNSPAIDVARAVNDFLRSERIVAQAAPGRQNPFQQIEQEVVVVPEPVGNSLIISATPRYFEQILELVEGLDEQPAQVMIQIIIAEVALDNLHEFGIELGIQDSLLFDRSLLGDLLTTTTSTSLQTPNGIQTTTQDTIVSASNTPGFDFNNFPLGNSGSTQALSGSRNTAGQGLSNFSLGRVNGDLDFGGMVLSASSANVSVLLRALEQSKSLEILSRPQVVTLDNQPAFIQVGQRVPRIVGTQLNQIGQVNNIEMENVGLILGVTPRISPDGNVVMEVDAEKSKLAPEDEGIPISVSVDGSVIRSPRVDIITAQTTVSAATGQTIVIGGLITSGNTSFTRKVPWLGDLPAVGRLFRYDGVSNSRKELLIILTPHIIRNEADADYIKQLEISRMSWVTSDIFDWLDSGCELSVPFSDSNIEVIYPDEDPNAESTGLPEPDRLSPRGHSRLHSQPQTEIRDLAPVPPAPLPPQPQSPPSSPPRLPGENGRGGSR